MAKKGVTSKKVLLTLLIIVFLVYVIYEFQYILNTPTQPTPKLMQDNNTIARDIVQEKSTAGNNITFYVANWNLQIFGEKKAGNPGLMQIYTKVIGQYDIVFVQEIRDETNLAFPRLCSELPEYSCVESSPAGRSSSKERYGVIYKKYITIINVHDFNPDSQNRWEKPPIEVTFNVSNYIFTAYNIHTKPEDADAELNKLEEAVPDQGNVMLLGDFNADCSYFNHDEEHPFQTWHWIIPDTADTTSGASDCAYDRIILNDNAFQNYAGYGIDTENIQSNVSDHYLVWVKLHN